jgi:hypothetical protein
LPVIGFIEGIFLEIDATMFEAYDLLPSGRGKSEGWSKAQSKAKQ